MSAADTAQIPVPRQYGLRHVDFAPEWRILDVGPGGFPLPGENVWHLDHDLRFLAGYPADHVIVADLNVLPLPITDKQFDFVWCSHVAEHVEDPTALARELSRIGKRGVLVVPHAFKDAMFCFEEPQHLWWFFPPRASGGRAWCVRADRGYMNALRDIEAQKALCRLYRSDPQVSYDHATLHQWLCAHAELLDVVVPWEGELQLEVLR